MYIEKHAMRYANELVNDYINGNEKTKQLFDYNFQKSKEIERRHTDISEQCFPRDELVNHLLTFNETYSSHHHVFENIRKLSLHDSTVVITGQQAGLLTGPLYTIYKAMTVIQLAQEYEKKLGKPVVPVFWVAGEDHDFQEINHLWAVENDVITKTKFPQKQQEKHPVSDIAIDKTMMEKWIQQLFAKYGESDKTTKVLTFLNNKIEQSDSFTDFFIHLMAALFEKYGLVFIDSGNKQLRKIESEFFHEIIMKNEQLQSALLSQQEKLIQLGYPAAIDTSSDCAHLFYHINGERELLFRDKNGIYSNKSKTIHFTEHELQMISKNEPEKLSNNVVTRPLMQDYLFPTLAFVAGPGEIAYWSYLKLLFNKLGKKMPPIIPRLSVTIIERHIQKMITEFHLNVEEVIQAGVGRCKQEWLEQQKDNDMDRVISETKHFIDLAHSKLRNFAWEFDHTIGRLSEKNRLLILSQIDFMQRKIEDMVHDRFVRELSDFSQVEAAIFPNKGWQERSWNVFYYMNHYGFDFVDRLFDLPLSYENNHNVLFL